MYALRRSPLAPLAILEDDRDQPLPFWQSPFRVREYEAILQAFPGAAVYSTWLDSCSGRPPVQFEEFLRNRPAFTGRVLPVRTGAHGPLPDVRLAYLVFLFNAFAFVDRLERHHIPFCLELYPGGCFEPGQAGSDRMLDRILGLPGFRRVIATQPLTRDFLINKIGCRPEQVEYLYGGVFADPVEPAAAGLRRRYGFEKGTSDLCFVAHRYMPRGEDKGYDVFVETARALLGRFPRARFHVVGDFDASVVPLCPELAGQTRFYGCRPSSFFPHFYSCMDAIVSPSRAYRLGPGAFDGFPTGCCIEAALHGTAVVCTDPLRLNRDYRDGEDLVLVEPDAGSVTERLAALLDEPERMRRIGEEGQRTFRRLFDPEVQVGGRLRLLEQELRLYSPLIRGHWPRRRDCFTRQYNAAELAGKVQRTVPDDETLRLRGCDYQLAWPQGDSMILVSPPPQWQTATEIVLTLPYAGLTPLGRVEFVVYPYRPFPDGDPFAMVLVAAAHDCLEEAPVARQELTVPPRFLQIPVVLETAGGERIRHVRFHLRMADGAEHNRNAVVKISHVAGLEARAA
jgi:glycosyltransferase involved in cell wall biosynthesis